MRYGTRIFSATVVVLLSEMIVGQTHATETLKVTPECGTIGFVGSKDDGSHVGGFKKFSGTVTLVPKDPGSSRVVLEIETSSLWADNPNLAAHLRNADFFHVEEFPKAVFRSTAVREAKSEDRKVSGHEHVTHVLSGELTLLGVSKKIQLPATIEVTDDTLTIKGTYHLDRTRFGMNYGLGKIHKGVPVSFSLRIPRAESTD
jgi:polyisoprenoid-binding protein YceI